MAFGDAQGQNGDSRVFVTKIPQQVSREAIAEYFARFGQTTDVYVPHVPGHVGHKGIAFVSFADQTALQLTVSHHPHIIENCEVVVDVAAPRGAAVGSGATASAPQKPEESDRLFVTKIPPTLQQEPIAEYFQQFGDITDIYLPSVPGSATHKGICFISFSETMAVKVCMERGPHEIMGNQVVVDIAATKGAGKGGKGKGGGKFGGKAPAAQGYGGGGGGYRSFSEGPSHGGGYYQPQYQQQQQQQYHPQQFGTGQLFPPIGYQPPNQFVPAGVQGPAGSMAGNPVPGRLFLTRVDPSISRMDLQMYFQQYGELNDVFVPNGGKGIAFVAFKDPSAAQRVLEAQQHYVKPGFAVNVDQAMDRSPLGGKGGEKGFKGTGRPY